MDFDLTEDQQEIKRVARDLLGARSTMARVREAAEARRSRACWRTRETNTGFPSR